MIIRIVKMTFNESDLNEFLTLFENVKQKIKNFDGCLSLSLLEDQNQNNILFTYSHWLSINHLETYRHSELFASTWKQTKSKFKSKAEAWTVITKSETMGNISNSKELN